MTKKMNRIAAQGWSNLKRETEQKEAAAKQLAEYIASKYRPGASGADTLAAKYAASHGIMSVQYHAQWSKYGKSAGPRRNEAMLVEGKPDLVVAFPGGRGTADMVRRARAAGSRVYEVHSVREPT